MKNNFASLLIVSFLTFSCSQTALDSFLNHGEISDKDQVRLISALENRDWKTAYRLPRGQLNSSNDIGKIRDAFRTYDYCKESFTRDGYEGVFSCLDSSHRSFDNLPDKTHLGRKTDQFIYDFQISLFDEMKILRVKAVKERDLKVEKRNKEIDIINAQNHAFNLKFREDHAKKIEEIRKITAERKKRVKELRKEEAAEKIRREKEIEEHKNRERRMKKALAARIKKKCNKDDPGSKADTTLLESITDGEDFDFIAINYGFKKLKKRPIWNECPLPLAIEAEKIPVDRRGKAVRAYGRVVQILTEKLKGPFQHDYITHGLLRNRRGDMTYFFSPGKTEGINKRSKVEIKGYFIQNYSYQTVLGAYVTAPVVIGKLKNIGR